MNKWDLVLAFLVSVVLGLWGFFVFTLISTPARFTISFFLILLSLIGFSIFVEDPTEGIIP